MHLPQSISDALHLNGGSSSARYGNDRVQTNSDVPSQHNEAKAQSNNQAEPLHNGDTETQTSSQANEGACSSLEIQKDHAHDQINGSLEPQMNGHTEPAELRINGDAELQTETQIDKTTEVHTNGDAKVQTNGDADSWSGDATEELKDDLAGAEIDRDAKPHSTGHTEAQTSVIAECQHNEDAETQQNGHTEPQTNGTAQAETNDDAELLLNDDVLSIQRNGGEHVQSNGQLTPHTNGTTSDGSQINTTKDTISVPSLVNSIQIPVLSTLLDSITAGWILLISRYQRDTFHNFTWGVKGAGDSSIQTIATEALRLGDVVTVADLLGVVRGVRSREIIIAPLEELVIFFNDGTRDEVSSLQMLRRNNSCSQTRIVDV
jgi:hypothetical protein